MKQGGIVLSTINAKWIHSSLALRLLKANLGSLEDQCEIIEFALRQPLVEKTVPILAACPRILGLSVSIWNHLATIELLEALEREWVSPNAEVQRPVVARPVVVLGGPEVSYLPPDSAIFRYADFVIRGEGEIAFRELCERITNGTDVGKIDVGDKFVTAEPVALGGMKTAYHLYTDEDLRRKLTYVEASRGCPFNCEFCQSAIKPEGQGATLRQFPLEQFFASMDDLIQRGARTVKFLDRTFNVDIARARQIMEFFLQKIDQRASSPLTVHFEMVPSLFPQELRETLALFPAGSLRLEIGLQSLNSTVCERIGRASNPELELETLRFLRQHTNAIIHADLIAGLPGEDLASFANGFDRLWSVLAPNGTENAGQAEIQFGILKLLPGVPIARHSETFGMRYNSAPPYEVLETQALPASELDRIKNFARFWELLVNRGLLSWQTGEGSTFEKFMLLSDKLLARFGRNWGIDKVDLLEAIGDLR